MFQYFCWHRNTWKSLNCSHFACGVWETGNEMLAVWLQCRSVITWDLLSQLNTSTRSHRRIYTHAHTDHSDFVLLFFIPGEIYHPGPQIQNTHAHTNGLNLILVLNDCKILSNYIPVGLISGHYRKRWSSHLFSNYPHSNHWACSPLGFIELYSLFWTVAVVLNVLFYSCLVYRSSTSSVIKSQFILHLL